MSFFKPATSPASAIPGAQPAAGQPAQAAQALDTGNARRLTVGPGISLTGEVSSCDVLVVEGTIQAKLAGARRVEVAAGGTFRGSADIAEAVVAGLFEGDLTVSGLLRVEATGLVTGTIRYGALEVARGGRVCGTLGAGPAEAPAKATATPKAA